MIYNLFFPQPTILSRGKNYWYNLFFLVYGVVLLVVVNNYLADTLMRSMVASLRIISEAKNLKIFRDARTFPVTKVDWIKTNLNFVTNSKLNFARKNSWQP